MMRNKQRSVLRDDKSISPQMSANDLILLEPPFGAGFTELGSIDWFVKTSIFHIHQRSSQIHFVDVFLRPIMSLHRQGQDGLVSPRIPIKLDRNTW